MPGIPAFIVTDTIVSGASTSSGKTLGEGCYWDRIAVMVPTMSTAAAIQVWTSADQGATIYQAFQAQTNTSTVGANSFSIASAVGANGGMIMIPVWGVNYLQFRATAVVSGGVAFKVICSS